MTKKTPSSISQHSIEEYQYRLNDNTVVDNSIPKLLVTGWIPRTTTFERDFLCNTKKTSILVALFPIL